MKKEDMINCHALGIAALIKDKIESDHPDSTPEVGTSIGDMYGRVSSITGGNIPDELKSEDHNGYIGYITGGDKSPEMNSYIGAALLGGLIDEINREAKDESDDE